MVSESQKAASAKWDKQHMTTVGCKVTKDKASKFREACKKQGTTANAVLLKRINEYIEEAEGQGQT